ncbi:MAG: ABC transporter substrate-binding protein [Lachnospiraceae bacterium]|jgi:iron(III) transport system substrate-binding protein|nr:ABC transporter substrate-binding protein [Lachnospiraceae bacterium]
MRKPKLLILILVTIYVAAFITACTDDGNEEHTLTGTLTVYTSMRESLTNDLVEGFTAIYPGITIETRVGGAGSLMREIEAERESGAIKADVIWTSEVPDFYHMKDNNLLLSYRPIGADTVFHSQSDADDYFIPARLGTLGIAYNTDLVSTPPVSWHDLTGSDFANGFAIANPATSGTAFISVGLLMEIFGEQFFRSLHANGAFVGQGSSQVVDAVATGELAACLAVDYMVFTHAEAGAPIAISYPPEMIVIPSPVAIFKNSPNQEIAKLFVDYLISSEAQQIIANSGTLPVLTDIAVPGRFNVPTVTEAMVRSIQVNDNEMYMQKDELVASFLTIMQYYD